LSRVLCFTNFRLLPKSDRLPRRRITLPVASRCKTVCNLPDDSRSAVVQLAGHCALPMAIRYHAGLPPGPPGHRRVVVKDLPRIRLLQLRPALPFFSSSLTAWITKPTCRHRSESLSSGKRGGDPVAGLSPRLSRVSPPRRDGDPAGGGAETIARDAHLATLWAARRPPRLARYLTPRPFPPCRVLAYCGPSSRNREQTMTCRTEAAGGA
jgi:hypothetical protein